MIKSVLGLHCRILWLPLVLHLHIVLELIIDAHPIQVSSWHMIYRRILSASLPRMTDSFLEQCQTTSRLFHISLRVFSHSLIGGHIAWVLALIRGSTNELLRPQIGMTKTCIACLSLKIVMRMKAIWHSIGHSRIHCLITVMINRVQTLLQGVLIAPSILGVHVKMVWLVIHDSLAASHRWYIIPVGVIHTAVKAVLRVHIHGCSLHLHLHLLLLGVVLVLIPIVDDDAFLEVLTCTLHLLAKVLLLRIHVTAHGSTKILLLLLQ